MATRRASTLFNRDDLDELNGYCRRYHHGENPNDALEPIDDAELQGYVSAL